MGQRTELFLEVCGQGLIGEPETGMYHPLYQNFMFYQQWGFGKGLALRLINLMNRYTMMKYDELKNGIDWRKFFSQDLDLSTEYDKEDLSDDNFARYSHKKINVKTLKSVLEAQANNDGYMVVRIAARPERYGGFGCDCLNVGCYVREYNKIGEYSSLKYVDLFKYLKMYEEEDRLIRYVRAALNYYSDGDYKSLTKDVLKDWETPLYILEAEEETKKAE